MVYLSVQNVGIARLTGKNDSVLYVNRSL